MAVKLRHGIFMAPFHKMDENPTLLFQQDMQLIEMLDRLGFHEAWIGEHHSAGMETISSPELFIAAVAERTKNIRLGTGVISLPYHNPLMVADRIVQLDHMTRGRVMFGVGPGLLASDALMLGIDPSVQRDRMAEGLDVILRLFKGEVVTEKTDWYELVGGVAAPAAVLDAVPGGVRGQCRDAVRRPAGGQVRPGHAVRGGGRERRLQRAGRQLGDRERDRGRAGPEDGPEPAAAGRQHAPGRDPRRGQGAGALRAQGSSRLPQQQHAAASSSRTGSTRWTGSSSRATR